MSKNQISKWRPYIDFFRANTIDVQEYSRDPFTVVILKASMPDGTIYTGVGVTKRVRYRKMYDTPNSERGFSIATDRAYKDLYNQAIGKHKSVMDLELGIEKVGEVVKKSGATVEEAAGSLSSIKSVEEVVKESEEDKIMGNSGRV